MSWWLLTKNSSLHTQTGLNVSCLWEQISRSRLRMRSLVWFEDWSMYRRLEISWTPKSTKRLWSRWNLSWELSLIIVKKYIWAILVVMTIIFRSRCLVHLMIFTTLSSIHTMYLRKKTGQLWKLHGRCIKHTVMTQRSDSRFRRGYLKRNLKTIFMIFRNASISMMELVLEAITLGSGQKNLKRRP